MIGVKSMACNYKLISANPDTRNIKAQILQNRGIVDVNGYLNLGTHVLHDPKLLGEPELHEFWLSVEDAFISGRKVFVLVDTDCDGYCSGAMMYGYLTKFLELENVEYILNKNKKHGLCPEVMKKLMSEDLGGRQGLLIIPDAGTNDVEQCKELMERYEVYIVDHHPAENFVNVDGKEVVNPYAVVINPQTSEYPNKNLCGAAVVYKVLQYFDEKYGQTWANTYLDLMAVAMIADVMDLRDPESRFLTTRGLMNVENKMLKAIIERNAYSISNTNNPNAIDIAFYVSPILNSCIRTGSDEEKDNLFRALLEADNGQTFPYKPRKSAKNPDPVEIDEDFYVHVARISSNLKSSKQDKPCQKELDNIVDFLGKRKDTKLIVLPENHFDYELIGVLANKVANTIMKPTIILKQFETTPDGVIYKGSARNFKNSYIEDLKKVVLESELALMVAGHKNAFGIEIYEHNVNALIDYVEELYKDSDSSKTYRVDYIIEGGIPYFICREVYEMRSLFSNFVEAPFVAATNVEVPASDVKVLAAQNGNLRFEFTVNDVQYIKFKLDDSDKVLELMDEVNSNDWLRFELVGKPNMTYFSGHATPQVIIDDYECEVL